MKNNDGCLICGSAIDYFDTPKAVACAICENKYSSNALCVEGHYVCDGCHREKGFEDIKSVAKASKSKNPIEIADEMMKKKTIHMHGPEHHFLVAAALLAAYVNQVESDDLEKKNPCNFNDSAAVKGDIIIKAEGRARNVPGGICGLWGSCGAAVGVGIFISIITEATPLTVESWSKANLAVSNALKIISENGGPRCCKRNTYLAITSAIEFLKKSMDIHLEKPKQIYCEYFELNNECKLDECLFYKII